MRKLRRILAVIAVLFVVFMVQAQQQKPLQQFYDSVCDRIWKSMVPGDTYIRDSSSEIGAVEILQRHDDAQITVQALVAGTVSCLKENKDYTALTLSDEKGKPYYYCFSRVVVKLGQKVAAGERLGFRPGVVRFLVTLTGPGDKPLDPRFSWPSVKELPSDADKPDCN